VRLMGWDLIAEAQAWGLPSHAHLGAWELLYLVRGRVDWDIDGRRYSSRGGEWNLVPPNTAHGGVDGVLHTCEMFWFSLDLEHGPDTWRHLATAFAGLPHRHFPAHPSVGPSFAQLWQEHRSPDGQSRIAARALIDQLLVQCVRDGHANQSHRPSPAIAAALELIAQHLTNPPRMEQIARRVGLGPARFHALFLAEIGCTPADHLVRLRIAHAQQLLRAGASIPAVAQQLGYATRAHFSNAFRRYTGEPPATWLASQAQHTPS